MGRFLDALRAFWLVLTDAAVAQRVAEAMEPPRPQSVDLRVLAVMQRDGRLVDFLQEDLDAYSDAQIGAAVRDIHKGCRKALREYLSIEPILAGRNEGDSVDVPADFDPASIRLTGNVTGSAPFRGELKHHGWVVRSSQLPTLPATRGGQAVLAPAEVELR